MSGKPLTERMIETMLLTERLDHAGQRPIMQTTASIPLVGRGLIERYGSVPKRFGLTSAGRRWLSEYHRTHDPKGTH